MNYYFKDDPTDLILGKLATTEFGDIYIDNDKLYIPETDERVYEYSYYTGNWNIIDGAVVIKNRPLPAHFNFDHLVVLNNAFFNFVKPCESIQFTDETKHNYMQEYYRRRRAEVCFPVINRGQLWYEHLTAVQVTELNDWYEAWLEAPDTLSEPVAPEWINTKLNKIENEELL